MDSLRAANRQADARGALGRFDRIERLSCGRNQQRDSGKQHRESKTERCRISGYPGRGEFLPGVARPRDGRAKIVQRGTRPHADDHQNNKNDSIFKGHRCETRK